MPDRNLVLRSDVGTVLTIWIRGDERFINGIVCDVGRYEIQVGCLADVDQEQGPKVTVGTMWTITQADVLAVARTVDPSRIEGAMRRD